MAKDFQRLWRGAMDGREREQSADIYALAQRYGLANRALADQLYAQSCREHANTDPARSWQTYERLLRKWAQTQIAPGKQTRTDALYGNPTGWAAPQPGVAPGKLTRTAMMAAEIAKREQFFRTQAQARDVQQLDPTTRNRQLPGYDLVMATMRSLDAFVATASESAAAAQESGSGAGAEPSTAMSAADITTTKVTATTVAETKATTEPGRTALADAAAGVANAVEGSATAVEGSVDATTGAPAAPLPHGHADAMTDRVVRGESAEPLLDQVAPAAQSSTSLQNKAAGSSANAVQMSGGWWDTLWRGAGIYLSITLKDEGSAYATALMRHYLLGGGNEFNPETSSINFPTDSMWSSFMAGRPEIQRAMETEFRRQALVTARSGSNRGHVSTSITNVRLNELESMRWTLHGCHRIEIEMDYAISDDGSGSRTVTFSNMHFRWIDDGDMHPGTVTETDSGEEIDDADLMGAGSSFPINIPFAAPGSSVWVVKDGAGSHKGGWPNSSRATSTRHRGE